MPAKLYAAAVVGLEGQLVEVEADVCFGFPSFTVVGLPDAAIQEARDRVRSALKNSGFSFPEERITVNLAPANLRKEGPVFDLAIALAILATQNRVEPRKKEELFMGELSLEGKVRPIKGALTLAILAQEQGIKKLFIPEGNAAEVSLIPGPEIYPINNLKQLINHLNGQEKIISYQRKNDNIPEPVYPDNLDMALIKGQEQAKRALEIAAAGGHNILMSGPPGSGKTLLAKTMLTIMPKMTWPEILESTRVYSVAGLLEQDNPLINTRPFRHPHHSASAMALVGGGRQPKPGEISLAHRGVLFLDEFPEFPRGVLEVLRQPLEDKVITVSRVQQTVTYPANFILVAAQNPCPCGYYQDETKECLCTTQQISNYQKKISGPLKDRLDLQIKVPRVEFKKLSQKNQNLETSQLIRKRVEQARLKQASRFEKEEIITNSEMTNKQMEGYCQLDEAGTQLMRQAVTKLDLSPRAYFRILKLARTIADLGEVKNIQVEHLAEALQFRQ